MGRGLEPGSGGVVWCYVCVSCEYGSILCVSCEYGFSV